MAVVNGSIPNMVNGVSQQPPHLRLPSQAQAILNGWGSVVEGQRKRPPTQHVAKLSETSFTLPYVHTINRDTSERYIMVIEDGSIKVYDTADGSQQTVNTPDGVGYLTAATPETAFRAVTVADYTFIVNQTVTVAKDAALAPTRDAEALVWVRAGSYGSVYSILIDGTERANYKVPDGGTASHADDVVTGNIATELYNDLVAWGGANFTFELNGSTIYITNDTADFTIEHADGQGDTALVVLKDTVQRFSDLPKKGHKVDFTLEVKGDQSSSFNSYFVKYDGDTWVETVEPGAELGLDPATMPHTLVSLGGGVFSFEEVAWETREVGNDTSNPYPSFTGKQIKDAFFHRNRLGFIADENVIMSSAGDFFDFFRDTITDVLDDDPIDVGTTHTKVSLLHWAIPYKQDLVVFADQTQFVLKGGDLLTSQTASFKPHTEFEIDTQVAPVGAGRSVYFAFNRGRFAGIRELFVSDDTDSFQDAPEVTAHVPNYLPRNTKKLVASSAEECLIAQPLDEDDTLYVYKWFWNGPEKVQSSWCKWTFNDGDQQLEAGQLFDRSAEAIQDRAGNNIFNNAQGAGLGGSKILNLDFIESTLYILLQNSLGEVHLDKLEIEPVQFTNDVVTWHMDRQFTVLPADMSYDSLTQKTTFAFPYDTERRDLQCYIQTGSAVGNAGHFMTSFEVISNNAAQIDGDVSNFTFVVGQPYTWEYELGTIYVQSTARNGASQSVLRGTLNLGSMTISFDDTGYVRAEVAPEGSETYSYVYAGRVTGAITNVIGAVAVNSGVFKFPLMSNNQRLNVKLINDTVLPTHVMSAEWEGNYVNHARRI